MSHVTNKTILFLGGGNMAEAIFGGMLSSGLCQPQQIYVAGRTQPKLDALSAIYGVHTLVNNPEGMATVLPLCDIVVLAVKPQVVGSVLPQLATALDATKHTVISIVGGTTCATLEGMLPEGIPLVRVMPNTPALVQEGAAGVALGTHATQDHGDLALEIFNAVGKAYLLPESLIDPLTGVSGCGPAFAYLFMEAMADGGVEMGLPRATAQALAAQTLLGAAKMVLETGEHPGKLKDNVCSPGGGTIAGVHALEQGAFRSTVMDAVTASVERMREVGKKSS